MRGRAAPHRAPTPSAPSRLEFADLELDEDAHRVWRAGTPVELSPTEFKLLRFFLLNPDRVLSRAQILDHVWEYDFGGVANVVETYVSYLRKKLDPLGEPADPHGPRRRLRAADRADRVAPPSPACSPSLAIAVVLAVADVVIIRTVDGSLYGQIDDRLSNTVGRAFGPAPRNPIPPARPGPALQRALHRRLVQLDRRASR